MKWSSPWSKGFPGWHIECTAMSNKYLGDLFDIHGGGIDLKFHHECEIAQANVCFGTNAANFWVHANMPANGQKCPNHLEIIYFLMRYFILFPYYQNLFRASCKVLYASSTLQCIRH